MDADKRSIEQIMLDRDAAIAEAQEAADAAAQERLKDLEQRMTAANLRTVNAAEALAEAKTNARNVLAELVGARKALRLNADGQPRAKHQAAPDPVPPLVAEVRAVFAGEEGATYE